jgi:hypothetical protein
VEATSVVKVVEPLATIVMSPPLGRVFPVSAFRAVKVLNSGGALALVSAP